MGKLKVAQIGTSITTHSAHILAAMLGLPDIFEVVGVADVDDWQRHYLPLDEPFTKVPRMTVTDILNYPGLDAVIIECEEGSLARYATMVAERKLPIQLEKPCGEDDAEFEKLMDLVAKNKTILHTSYMFRYNPAVMAALEKVRSGEIGTVYSVEGQMNVYHNTDFRNVYTQRHKGGIMFYLGCHMVDIIYIFMGEPKEILSLNISLDDKVIGEDYGFAVFKYDQGQSFAKVSAAEVGGSPDRRYIIICGSKGTLEISPIEQPTSGGFDLTYLKETYIHSKEVTLTKFPPHKRYDLMLKSFAKMVRGEMANPYSYDHERRVHKLLLKACGYENIE